MIEIHVENIRTYIEEKTSLTRALAELITLHGVPADDGEISVYTEKTEGTYDMTPGGLQKVFEGLFKVPPETLGDNALHLLAHMFLVGESAPLTDAERRRNAPRPEQTEGSRRHFEEEIFRLGGHTRPASSSRDLKDPRVTGQPPATRTVGKQAPEAERPKPNVRRLGEPRPEKQESVPSVFAGQALHRSRVASRMSKIEQED